MKFANSSAKSPLGWDSRKSISRPRGRCAADGRNRYIASVSECPLNGRYWGQSRHARSRQRSRMTLTGLPRDVQFAGPQRIFIRTFPEYLFTCGLLNYSGALSKGHIHMSHRQSKIHEVSAKDADPLADARAWLAAMEASLRRTALQAQQSSNVITLRSAQAYDVPPGNQFLEDSGRMRTG